MVDTRLGSAKFSNAPGINPALAIDGRHIVAGYSFNPPFPSLHAYKPNRHQVTISSTRGGKGVSLIVPNLLLWKASAVVIDPKGELAWITSAQHGAEHVRIIDPWDEVNRVYAASAARLEGGPVEELRVQTVRFNPLSAIDPNSPDYADDLAFVGDAFIINQSERDPYFDNAARQIFIGLCAYAVETYGKEATLDLVRQYVTLPVEAMTELAKKAQELGTDSIASRKLSPLTGAVNASVIDTLRQQTSILDTKSLRDSMAVSDFSFDDLLNGDVKVYLVLPVDKLRTYGRWLRIMLSLAIKAVIRSSFPLQEPVLFICDEFGTVGHLEIVEQAFGLMAGKKICLWIFLQSLQQLQRDYGKSWETFISGAEAITAFGVGDHFTAEYLSKLMGTQTIERDQVTQSFTKGVNLTSSRNYSTQTMTGPLVRPEEIINHPDHSGFLLGRGDPILYRKIVYYNEAALLKRLRPDPMHGMTRATVAEAIRQFTAKPAAKKLPVGLLAFAGLALVLVIGIGFAMFRNTGPALPVFNPPLQTPDADWNRIIPMPFLNQPATTTAAIPLRAEPDERAPVLTTIAEGSVVSVRSVEDSPARQWAVLNYNQGAVYVPCRNLLGLPNQYCE